jgi:membrane protein DedA with SNARE-associated domain
MYGVLFALPLVCLCVATGASMCYLISALLGPALLLTSQRWRDRLDVWRERIRKQGGNMISYLIILRCTALSY